MGQQISVTLTGYSGCGSINPGGTNTPAGSNCCVNKSWNLAGPLPGYDYTSDDPDVVPCVTNAPPEPFWPSARYGQAMDYHAQTQALPGPCVLLFGGIDGSGVMNNETWLWNGSLWSPTVCNPTIPPRCFHAMAYDPTTGKSVVFGGLCATGLTNDTWQWDSISSAGEWIEATPSTPPSARQGHAMVYDPDSDSIVLFGGLDTNGLQGDTWIWHDPFWDQKFIPGPSPRQGHAMVYDQKPKGYRPCWRNRYSQRR